MYETAQISFQEDEIRLLRNRFIYKRISYNNIKSIEIYDGYLIKNRILIIALCIMLIILGVFVLIELHNSFNGIQNMPIGGWFNRQALVTVWGPLLMIVIGISGIVSALLKSKVIEIKSEIGNYVFQIKELSSSKDFKDFLVFIKSKVRNVVVYQNT